MTDSKYIDWKLLTVEGIAIVTSILLAFAIDAWWAGRKTDEWQVTQLTALKEEFQQNIAEFVEVARRHNQLASSNQQIADATKDAGPGEEVRFSGEVLTSLISWRTSNLATGSLDALLASGRLGDIANPQLRSALAAWPAIVLDAQEDERIARDFVENVVVPSLVGRGMLEAAYKARSYPGSQGQPVEPYIESSVVVSQELIELATIRRVHSLMAFGSIQRLEGDARELLSEIDAELGRLE